MKKNRIQSYKPLLLLTVSVLMLSFKPIVPIQAQSLADLLEDARSAGIEQTTLSNLQDRAEARGISDEELISILRPAISMAEENLPHGMIFEKALEGISKRVPVGRIEPVLNSIAASSSQAAEFVDRWVERPEVGQMLGRQGERMDRDSFRNEMIRASSKGLMQNFDREILEQTLDEVAGSSAMERARPSGIITAISVMSDLPGAAQEPAETARIVLKALEGGFDASDLQKLPGAMNMAQRRSQLPVQAVAEGLTRQLQGGLPASQILQNLFSGEVGGPPGNVPPGLDRNRPGRGQQGGPP